MYSAIASVVAFAIGHGVNIKQRKLLASFAAPCAALICGFWRGEKWAASCVNPLRLPLVTYFSAYAIKVLALKTLDYCLVKKWGGQPRGKLTLDCLDRLCLFSSSILETLFTFHVVALCLRHENILWLPRDMDCFNCLLIIPIIFTVDDMVYGPAHYAMHTKYLYGYIHEQHHRQRRPFRGYDDAGNEHPLEQVIGQALLYGTLVVLLRYVQIHVVAVLLQFVAYATFAIVNHLPQDVELSVCGFRYQNKLHEIHHARFKFNYAQNVPLFDIAAGTLKLD